MKHLSTLYQNTIFNLVLHSQSRNILQQKNKKSAEGTFMKWPKKHTKNLIYKSLLNTEPKTEDQIINAAINLAVKKELYKFDSGQDLELNLSNVDIKDQSHIIDTVKEIIKDLTENELLRVNPDTTVSLTTDGMSYVLSALPKAYF
jgi:hypothetical protein